MWSDDRFNLATGGEVRYAKGIRVSGDFFSVLGIRPILGRLLGPEDDRPGCALGGANISYAFWQRNFGGDPAIVGKRLSLNGSSFEIVGVTPPNFNGISVGDTYDVAVPICVEPILNPLNNRLTMRHGWWLASIGRLKQGWTIERANAQIAAVTPQILQETIPTVYDADGIKHYLEYKFGAFSASTGFSELREDSETSLWLLLGISGLVLLIACANLANLMLARAGARERQITIRRALGATRWRMIRDLLSESLLLALAGSFCGLFLAYAVSRGLIAFISTPQQSNFARSGHGLAGACLHDGACRHHHNLLRTGPGHSRHARGTSHLVAVRQPRLIWWTRTFQPPPHPGCLSSGPLGRPPDGRAAICPQPPQPHDTKRRIPAEWDLDCHDRLRAFKTAGGTLYRVQTRPRETCAGDSRGAVRRARHACPLWGERVE